MKILLSFIVIAIIIFAIVKISNKNEKPVVSDPVGPGKIKELSGKFK